MGRLQTVSYKGEREIEKKVLTISHFEMQFILVLEFFQPGQLILQSLEVPLCRFVLLRECLCQSISQSFSKVHCFHIGIASKREHMISVHGKVGNEKQREKTCN